MTTALMSLDLHTDGAALHSKAASRDSINAALDWLAGLSATGPGARLFGCGALSGLVSADGVLGAIAVSRLGSAARPVRAILFDKTPGMNWGLGWHQDRVIAIKARKDNPGFGPWTRKGGVLHVAPPFDVLAGMLTLRPHLDDTPQTNAPLLIAPGSHRLGRIPERDIAKVVAACGVLSCLAEAGDVWVYSTPILHASAASEAPGHRRVLQVDYAAEDLPGGLEWAGWRTKLPCPIEALQAARPRGNCRTIAYLAFPPQVPRCPFDDPSPG